MDFKNLPKTKKPLWSSSLGKKGTTCSHKDTKNIYENITTYWIITIDKKGQVNYTIEYIKYF